MPTVAPTTPPRAGARIGLNAGAAQATSGEVEMQPVAEQEPTAGGAAGQTLKATANRNVREKVAKTNAANPTPIESIARLLTFGT